MAWDVAPTPGLAHPSPGEQRFLVGRSSLVSTAVRIAGFLLVAGGVCVFSSALAQSSRTIGLIGDSLTAATNAYEMCGPGKELPSCLDEKFGRHDFAWSYAGGSRSFSIAARLGYTPAQTRNVAEDGARWEDALGQASRLDAATLGAVFINLGSSDVCRDIGHNYTGDLTKIAGHIDRTLSYLIRVMPAGGRIYWSGIPNLVGFRNVMASRRHNYMFRSCQATWDLDSDAVTEAAAASLCHAAGASDAICTVFADTRPFRDALVARLLAYYRNRYKIEDGPCGRVLSSSNTPTDLLKAQQFNGSLNSLFANKAQQYNGRNGIRIVFRNILYNTPVKPNFVSRLDCYHPNRAGQMKIAELLWKAFAPNKVGRFAYWYDEFDDGNPCTQELGLPWASCWYDYGDGGFDIRVDEEGWLKVQKDTSKQRRHYVVRELGDLSGMSNAWMSFNHKRENLDDDGDRVYFNVYKNGLWYRLDQFQGGGNDLGEHAGKYYNLTPYLSPDFRIMFETENQGSMRDGDRVKFDNFNIFAWRYPPS